MDVMLMSEVSALSGLEPKTIRFYERAKLLSPRRHGRIRIYRTPDLERLRLIKQLRSFDMPIATIREILKDPESLSLNGTMNDFGREVLSKHLEELAARQIQIQDRIRELSAKLNLQVSDTRDLATST